MDDTLGAVATVDAGATGGEGSASTTVTETAPTGTQTSEGTPAGIPEVPVGGGPEGGEGETPEGLGEAEGGEGDEADLSGGDGDVSAAELATRKAISDLKKTNPAAAKAWAKEHYENGAYKKEFGTVAEARSAKATIESLGGEEGITKINEELDEHRGDVSRFHEGNPQLPQDLIEANIEGSATLASGLLQQLGEKNPDLYDQALIPHMSSRLENANIFAIQEGIGKAFETLENFIKEGDGQGAFDLLQKIKTSHKSESDWFGRLRDMAGKTAEKVAKRDPAREAFEKEKSEFAATKAKEHFDKIGSDVNRMNNAVTAKLVDPFFKSLKLNGEGRQAFTAQLYSNIFKAIKDDKTFKRQESAIRARGNVKESAEFIHAKFASLLPDHFRKLRNSLYPNWKPTNGTPPPAKPNGAPPAGSTVQSGATVTLEQARQIGIDFSKTSQLDWIRGTNVTLKNGKVVSVDRSK